MYNTKFGYYISEKLRFQLKTVKGLHISYAKKKIISEYNLGQNWETEQEGGKLNMRTQVHRLQQWSK